MTKRKEIIPVLSTTKESISRQQQYFNSRVKKINKFKGEVSQLEEKLDTVRKVIKGKVT